MSFLNHISKYKKKIALTDGKIDLSYEKLIEKAKKFTSKIKKKSLIFLIANNDLQTIFFYLGLVLKKNSIVLLSGNIKEENLKKLSLKYKPKYIITKKKTYIGKFKLIDKKNDYNIFEIKEKISYRISKKLSLLLSTSGTTGSPKFVKLSYENLTDNIRNIVKSIKIKTKDSVITTLPISYTFGLSVINTFLFSGSKIFINEKSIMDKKFWVEYKKFKPTHFYGVPFTFEILSKLKFKNLFTGSLKTLAVAGGKLSQEILKKLVNFTIKKKIKFYNMYGQTEASPRMAVLDDKYKLKKINSIGKPINGGKFFLVSEKKKRILAPYTKGSLYYSGKNVYMGYSKSFQDLNKENHSNKLLDTGDLAFFDSDNFFYIIGRKKRFIKLFGIRLNLDDIEDTISKLGFNCKCDIVDNIIKINYNNKKIRIKKISEILSKQLNVNQNYIQFKYVKNFLDNKKNPK